MMVPHDASWRRTPETRRLPATQRHQPIPGEEKRHLEATWRIYGSNWLSMFYHKGYQFVFQVLGRQIVSREVSSITVEVVRVYVGFKGSCRLNTVAYLSTNKQVFTIIITKQWLGVRSFHKQADQYKPPSFLQLDYPQCSLGSQQTKQSPSWETQQATLQ